MNLDCKFLQLPSLDLASKDYFTQRLQTYKVCSVCYELVCQTQQTQAFSPHPTTAIAGGKSKFQKLPEGESGRLCRLHVWWCGAAGSAGSAEKKEWIKFKFLGVEYTQKPNTLKSFNIL